MKIPEILLIETVHQPGSLAKVLQVIADAGLAIEHLAALRRDQGKTLWEITLGVQAHLCVVWEGRTRRRIVRKHRSDFVLLPAKKKPAKRLRVGGPRRAR